MCLLHFYFLIGMFASFFLLPENRIGLRSEEASIIFLVFSFYLFCFLKYEYSCGTVSCTWWRFLCLHFHFVFIALLILDFMKRSGNLNLNFDVLLLILYILNGHGFIYLVFFIYIINVNILNCKDLQNSILIWSCLLNVDILQITVNYCRV